jgi:dihydroorotase
MLFLNNFRIVDEASDFYGSVVVENGFIKEVLPCGNILPRGPAKPSTANAGMTIEGGGKSGLVLMPAFVDLHAHFREPGFGEVSPKETLESACLAAATGGYGTVVAMANTRPPVDSVDRATFLKKRADVLGLIDLCPVLSLTKGMDGKELSEITKLPEVTKRFDREAEGFIRMLSEDGRDPVDDSLFLAAFLEARRAGLPVSCHCDLGGEYAAVRRALGLAARAGAKIHIAHVSTKAALDLIRGVKAGGPIQLKEGVAASGTFSTGSAEDAGPAENESFVLSCEITPHHLALDEKDALALGAATFGKVAPPLGSGADRLALFEALGDGTADAIATDHAPHTQADKAAGAPGFSGLETAFAVCYSILVAPEVSVGPVGPGKLSLQRLSALMSASPARILGFGDNRGKIAPGYRADLVIVDTEASWTIIPENFKSRGKNSPFRQRELKGKVLVTIHRGRVVFDGR